MALFLTTVYEEVPGRGNNPPSYRAKAKGRQARPGEAADFSDRSYIVADDGSVRRERHARVRKKLRRKIRKAVKAAQARDASFFDVNHSAWLPPEPPASTCRLTDIDKVEA